MRQMSLRSSMELKSISSSLAIWIWPSPHLSHEDRSAVVPDLEDPVVGYHRLAEGEKRPAEGDLASPDGDPVLRRAPVEYVDLALLHIQAPPFDLV